ncbi:glycosyltransferase [Ralstonia solanacearum]|uniref:glycosyltransferase family 4 protein n=1 Tax=Ralstonia solanacearum TaxID=305 RepID=UPI0005C78C1F|nr:glycosyltransferase [Ralstonia solanacearum]MDB0542249.1 glycosyltransferase [Ralstonia solanacearum]MDB0552479.1 glycosyltransferase [Ralstonia solanacearum]MDB0557213.1 glycosyltransferase [Ralstonia solanacearum]
MSPLPMVLVAYQCGPGMGSVSQIGWEWFSRLARRHPLTLVTHVRNRSAIEAADALPPGASVHYIDTEWLARPLYGLARRLFPRSEHSVFLVSQLDFFAFDRLALRALRRLRQQGPGCEWQLLHMVTPVTLSAPTCLHRLGLPLVRGPLNCGLGDPPGFASVRRAESGWLWRLRALPRLLDRLLGSSAGASALLVASRATAAAVPLAQRARCVDMIENAVEPDRFPAVPPLPDPGPERALEIAFVGRLVPVKGLDLLLRAMQRLQQAGRPVRLTVGGEGPMRTEWEALADELGLRGVVRFAGRLAPHEVAATIAACHVFCLPSVRESGGAVLLEAMACGRPVIAMDFGGPAEIVDNTIGRLVPVDGPARTVDGLEAALLDCLAHPQDWRLRGSLAQARVRERHTWQAKIEQAEQLYRRVLAAPP